MADEEIPKTQIGVLLQQAMDQEGLSIRDLSGQLDMTYEYVRRLTQGMNLPSKTALKLICQRFKWKYSEMEPLLVQDRFRLRNGQYGAIAQEFNPEVEPFERGWNMLEKSQKEILLAQLQHFISQNRRHVRGGLKSEDGGKKE